MEQIINILHLEDNILDARLVEESLIKSNLKFSYFFADNEADFLGLLKNNNIDIILSDYHLPDYSGLEALSYIKNNYPFTPFIFVSGAMGEDAAIESLRNGATDYVLKHKLERLVPAVQRAIKEHEEIKARRFAESEMQKMVQDLLLAKERAEKSEENLRLINRELYERNEFIQKILDNLPIGLGLNKFNEGEATYMNKKFQEIYGWDESEITSIPQFFEKVYPDENYRKQIVETITNDINSGDSTRMHWENIIATCKDGTRKIINAVNIPLAEQNTMVSTVMDVTALHMVQKDLIKAKEKAEESDRLKTAFLQNMSHEIRTPLNAISGFSGLLNKPDLSDEKRKSFIQIIQNSSNQLISIVSDILTISSLETKQEKLNINKVYINNIIVDLLAIFKQQAQNQNISLYVKQQLNDKQSEIYTDKTKITQILSNLLSNALKFTHKGFIEFGYEYVETRRGVSLPELQFYVKDTGIGIKQEYHDKIFERFRQADKSINKLYGGTGLGLAISKAFVELFGGKIWVESEPEKGSIFYFTIPYNPVNEIDKTISPTKQNENFKTIIVAEDEEFNFLFIEELLIDLDLKLIHTKDGQETVDIFKANPNINLILMDIKMPIMTGHEAAKIIKELKPDLPIIAQSAYALEHERAKYEGIFDDYLTKPINENELKQKIMKYIEI